MKTVKILDNNLMYKVTIVSDDDKKRPSYKVKVRVKESGDVYECSLTAAMGGYIFGIPFPSKGLHGEFTKNVHKSVEDWREKLDRDEKCEFVDMWEDDEA